LIETGLRNSSRDERLTIRGDQRRELKWALDQLLFRKKTSREAVRLLWLLAEAENEGYANNTTGIVAECFYAFHPQLPLSLLERLDLLREFTAENTSETGKLVAIKAIKDGLSGRTSVMLRHSTGPEPLDSGATFTYGDFYDYARNLVDILIALAQKEGEVARAALAELPELMAEIGIKARPQEALERFSMLVEWARSGKPGLEVSSLIGALRYMHKALSTALAEPEFPSERRDEFQTYLAELERLKSDLETANFATRLQRWAGKWAYGDHEDEFYSDGTARFEREITKLADEVVKNPSLLNPDLVEWLLSSLSQRTDAFFFFLGTSDAGLIFRECIEALGSRPDGAGVFSAYWGGWAKRDHNTAEKRLDQLTSSHAVTGTAIVLGTVSLGIHQGAISRIIAQIQAGRVDPEYAGRVILAKWFEELTENQFEQLIKAVAGDNFEHGATVVDMLNHWSYCGRPMQGSLANFAWQCVGHDISVRSSTDAWHFDQLAARLAQNEPERSFELLKKLLQRYDKNGNYWDPLEPYGDHAFWKVLYTTDRKRLIGLLLNLAQTDALRRHRLSRRLRELLAQEEDKELLLSFAIDNVENARIIASFITSAKAGFWPIAFELVQKYPYDAELLRHLTAGVGQLETAMRGSMAQFYETRKQEVEQRLHEPSTPPEARAWLREVLSRLEREVPRQIVWEYDIDVDDLRGYIRDKNSTQRLWAIGRVLRYATWEDIRRLLTVEDIADALPYTDLPEQRRKMLERALEIWQYGK
jgi:hypothetical protein